MRVIVCGGRDFKDKDMLYRVMNTLHREYPIVVLFEGGARGADRYAAQWAAENGIEVQRVRAKWNRYGLAAGARRNQHMLWTAEPHRVIAFPGGAGTEDMVQKAINDGYPVIRVKEDGTYDNQPFI